VVDVALNHKAKFRNFNLSSFNVRYCCSTLHFGVRSLKKFFKDFPKCVIPDTNLGFAFGLGDFGVVVLVAEFIF
jgi:hypothetical protein